MKYHHAHPYLITPTHKISINVVGVGGTGSRVLTSLAIMDKSLKELGHPGLHVTAFDDDNVTQPNIGRQVFVQSDLGLNKAVVIVSRINRMLGIQWDAYPYRYEPSLVRSKDERFLQANILISCVDSLSSRRLIKNIEWHSARDYNDPLYWLDIGNGRNYGQYILSTIQLVDQPEGGISFLPDIFEIHPEIMDKEDDTTEPSCSLAEALTKQDLFVNPIMAMQGCHLLWRLITEKKVSYQGGYVNLDNMQTNLITLK